MVTHSSSPYDAPFRHWLRFMAAGRSAWGKASADRAVVTGVTYRELECGEGANLGGVRFRPPQDRVRRGLHAKRDRSPECPHRRWAGATSYVRAAGESWHGGY
jgi:hypothetical protein